MKRFLKIGSVLKNNKKLVVRIGIIMIVFTVGFIAGRIRLNPYGAVVKKELSRYDEGSWVVKVDDYKIGGSYLDQRYDTYKKIHSSSKVEAPLLKDVLLRKLIDNYVVMSEIERSGLYRSKGFTDFVWYYTEEAMVSYYLDAMSRINKKDAVSLGEKDKEAFYNANKSMFDKKGKSKEEAMKIIEQQVSSLNETMNERNRLLNERIELGKLKKGKKIEFNTAYLAKDK